MRLDPERAGRGAAATSSCCPARSSTCCTRLIARAGEIVTRDELMRDVWHTTFWTSSKTIDVHLGWVRRKLGDDARRPHLITTIRGRGLRFERARRRVDGAARPPAEPRGPRGVPR